MQGKLGSFRRKGIQGKLREINADLILRAIAAGKDIEVEYCLIYGDLDIRKIVCALHHDKCNRLIAKSDLIVRNCRISDSSYISN